MNMLLLQPVMLWTAFAGIIPIAIHLWYRDTGKIVEVGSAGWFQKADKNKIKRVKLHEKRLLLLRLLFLFLLSLLLAGPILFRQMPAPKAYQLLLIDHELKDNPKVVDFKDSVVQLGNYEIVYVAEEHQSKEDSITFGKPWHALQQYSQREFGPAAGIYFTKSKMQQFDTDRPTLDYPVTIIPVEEPSEILSAQSFAFAFLQDNVLLSWYEKAAEHGVSLQLYRDTIQQQVQPLQQGLSFRQMDSVFHIVSAQEDTIFTGQRQLPLSINMAKEDSMVLIAAIRAITTHTGLKIYINEQGNFNHVSIGKDMQQGSASSQLLFGDSVSFIGNLGITENAGLPSNLEDFQLLTLLLQHLGNYTLQEIVDVNDGRKLPEAMLKPKYSTANASSEYYEAEIRLHYPILLLLCIVLISERLYAGRREQDIE